MATQIQIPSPPTTTPTKAQSVPHPASAVIKLSERKARAPLRLERDYFKQKVQLPSERYAAGKAMRELVPRESHAEWKEPVERPDLIDILSRSNKGRLPELVPIRHARMITSPFAFLRGSAAVMAYDLAQTPSSGIRVQACGDCHLLNFGAFATPERRLNFDINDFDETLPAPWEWDVKRLAASIVVAGRYIALKERESKDAAERAVRSYRRQMARYAEMPALDVWYDHVDIEQLIDELSPERQEVLRSNIEKARSRSIVEHDFPRLTESRKGKPRIKDNPPLIFHPAKSRRKEARDAIFQALKAYRGTLADPYRVLLDRFKFYDLAIKVVGVGSVGTMCMVILLMASDSDPLFLQVKQATASVLEPYAGPSKYSNHGQRVVMGQRLMQSASDMLLGWTIGNLEGRHYYLRQLRDMKISATIETADAETLRTYAKICGRTLARAHARSGDPAMISGYLGNSDVFDEAIVQFASAYADQTESDHRTMRKAVRDGRVEIAQID